LFETPSLVAPRVEEHREEEDWYNGVAAACLQRFRTVAPHSRVLPLFASSSILLHACGSHPPHAIVSSFKKVDDIKAVLVRPLC
jgi:hypothetical protein